MNILPNARLLAASTLVKRTGRRFGGFARVKSAAYTPPETCRDRLAEIPRMQRPRAGQSLLQPLETRHRQRPAVPNLTIHQFPVKAC
jgi:hypothetical protein